MTTRCHPPTPCNNCPFRRVGGIRLRRERILEIAAYVAPEDGQGASFACHKTTGVSGGPRTDKLECAGGMIFAYKQGLTSQMTRIAERLGLVSDDLADDHAWPEVFDNVDEMLKTADDRPNLSFELADERRERTTPTTRKRATR